MKKTLALLLAVLMTVLILPTSVFADSAGKNKFGCQTIEISTLGAFEESHKGYLSEIIKFDGKNVRSIWRDGSDDTANQFNLYFWSSPVPDINDKPIPLSTANYIVIDYYYKSPDASPALAGNKMRWIQGRVTSAENISAVMGFEWSIPIISRNGMVANKWDKLVLPVDECVGNQKAKALAKGEQYLHQMKLFPLQGDMGKNDILYIGDITVQSWDPADESGIAERNILFYTNETHAGNPEKAFNTIKAKDITTITIPEFTATAPANCEFKIWRNLFDGNLYRSGDKYDFLAGVDVEFVPEYNYIFDFKAYENAYINGYPDGTFLPQNNVTRAEAIKIIASLVNPSGTTFDKVSFTDVAASDWFYNSVATLEFYGALDIWQGKLEPSTPITRSEFVEIIYAVSDHVTDSMKFVPFSDVESTNRCYDAVMYAVATGLVAGYEDGTFRPDNSITRAETVTIINRMLGRVWNEQGTAKFTDIDAHWAKGQIIASSTSKADGAWNTVTTEKEYVLEGTKAEDYIKALYAQSKNLSGEAIRRGVDVIAEQMKKDILSTPNTQEIYPDRFTKTTYYVSEKNGDDANDGKSPETAVKTIQGVNNKLRFPGKGTSILFERGGIYRGQVVVTTGLTYGAYGTGDKPVISGSLKNYADPALWKETDAPNVYELTDKLTNVGVITFDHAPNAHGNYHDLHGKNRIFGKNIASYLGLIEDLQFFSCENTLYLCSTKGNPGTRFKSIEIGTRTDVFDGSASDIVIDNLHIKHTGAHGIGLGSGTGITVTNCEFSWLGGSLLGSYGQTTTQYGNAVEFYGNGGEFYVRDNWMWQIHDSAVTHQGKALKIKDVQYQGNLMEYVHWGIESWLTKESDSTSRFDGYLAQYNISRMGGYGWGTVVPDRVTNSRLYTLYNYTVPHEDLLCEYNIFDRAAGHLIFIDQNIKDVHDKNIYIQDEGKLFGDLKGKTVYTSANTAADIKNRLKTDDFIFVYIPKK